MNLLIVKRFLKCCAFILPFLNISNAHAEDSFISFTATDIIGYEQSPTVYIELKVNKTRDLHVVFQTLDGSQTFKRTMKRIKKSGKYHFEVPIDNLKAGKYRIASYLTPRGKNWNERISQAQPFQFQVVDQKKYIETVKYNNEDQIKLVDWPKRVIGAQDATLTVKYVITKPRDLHVNLLDSENWKEYGALVIPVSESGNYTLPLSNLPQDFPVGKYAWVIYLTAKDDVSEVSEKYGKHFILANDKDE